jgi:clan AA aspartic protease (TIGR02281 family)
MERSLIHKSITILFLLITVIFFSVAAWAGYTEFTMGGPIVVHNDDNNEQSKVIIKGNSVIVPTKIFYGTNDAEVKLLLDTGASKTMINTDVAERLSIKLDRARKTQVHVVGGATIDAYVVRVKSLTFGIHTKRNWDIVVVPHNGPAVEYEGLLGMDVLRGLKYRIDFKKNLIVWE